MNARTEGGWQRRGLRAVILAAAVLAGAGAHGLSASVDNVADGTYGALPLKEPGTAQVIGYYCTATDCYHRETGSKYRFCCIR